MGLAAAPSLRIFDKLSAIMITIRHFFLIGMLLCVPLAGCHGDATADIHEFLSSTEGWITNFNGDAIEGHTGGQNGTGLSASNGDLAFTLKSSRDTAVSTGFSSRNLSRWNTVFVELTASHAVTVQVFHQSGPSYNFNQGSAVAVPAGQPTRVVASLEINNTDKSAIQAFGIRVYNSGQNTDVRVNRAGVIGAPLPSRFSLPHPFGTEYWILRSGSLAGNSLPLEAPPPGNGLERQASSLGDGDGVLVVNLPAGTTSVISTDISREDFSLEGITQLAFHLASNRRLLVRPFIETTENLQRSWGDTQAIPEDNSLKEVIFTMPDEPQSSQVRAIGIQLSNQANSTAKVQIDSLQEKEDLPPLQIENIQPSGETIERYARFEVSFGVNRVFEGASPFNPDIIDISAEIRTPSGKTAHVPGFYTQDFTITNPSFENYTPVGSPYWKVRFAPSETGLHTWRLHARDQSGEVWSATASFTVTPSERKGFIRLHTSHPYLLEYEQGGTFFPIGHNIAFGDGNPPNLNGTAYYTPLLQSLQAAGGNWTRIWMTDFERSAIEWSASHWSGFYGGVGVYSLKAACRIEKIIEIAESLGITVQLVINDHGQFSSWVNARWNENPYNSTNGGMVPSGNPEQFFTSASAIEMHQRRLRYIVARYGAYTNLSAWELFNEVQFTGRNGMNWFNSQSMRSAIASWHQVMASWIKTLDPFQHLVTTSSDESGFQGIWELPDIDLTQIHDYSAPASERDIHLNARIRSLQTSFGKPAYAAEFGIGAAGAEECNFNPGAFSGTTAERDHMLQGTHLHNSLWATAMTNSMAAIWWWGCYLEPDASHNRNAPNFPLHGIHYPPIKTFFEGEGIEDPEFLPLSLSVPSTIIAFGAASSQAARLWVRDKLNTFGSGAGPGNLSPERTLSGVEVTLPSLLDDQYEIDFFDPWTGNFQGSQSASASAGQGLRIALPDFQRDLAIRVRRQNVSVTDWRLY